MRLANGYPCLTSISIHATKAIFRKREKQSFHKGQIYNLCHLDGSINIYKQ